MLVDCRKCGLYLSGTSCILYDNILNLTFGSCSHYIERKEMDKIEIDVRINGKVSKLSDISDETLRKMKKLETRTPIEHGDYGYYNNRRVCNSRVFLANSIGGPVSARCYDGHNLQVNVNTCDVFDGYVILGNIFKDLKRDLI